MTQPSIAFPSWMDAWNEAQRCLWESWLALGRPPAAAQPEGQAAGWQASLDLWRKALFPAADPATAELGRRLTEQWAAWQRWAQSLSPAGGAFPATAFVPGAAAGAQAHQSAVPTGADWAAYLQQLFAPMAAMPSLPAGATWAQTDAVRGLLAALRLPMDMWGRATASLSAFPGGALASPRDGAAPFDFAAMTSAGMAQAPFEPMLATPPLGYAREHQERGQRAMQDWLAFQNALNVYMGVLTRIAARTAEVIRQRTAERMQSGKPLEGVRQLYDFFVDCAEDAYAEVVTAADFGRGGADLMNAAMAVKRHAQAAADEMATAANLPTRRELDTSHRQLQRLRRQLLALQEEMRERHAAAPAGDGAALEREVQALRTEVAELRALLLVPTKAAGTSRGRQAAAEKVEG